jgi:hypothetical protein
MSNHSDLITASQFAHNGLVDVEGIVIHILPVEDPQAGMLSAKEKKDIL